MIKNDLKHIRIIKGKYYDTDYKLVEYYVHVRNLKLLNINNMNCEELMSFKGSYKINNKTLNLKSALYKFYIEPEKANNEKVIRFMNIPIFSFEIHKLESCACEIKQKRNAYTIKTHFFYINNKLIGEKIKESYFDSFTLIKNNFSETDFKNARIKYIIKKDCNEKKST